MRGVTCGAVGAVPIMFSPVTGAEIVCPEIGCEVVAGLSGAICGVSMLESEGAEIAGLDGKAMREEAYSGGSSSKVYSREMRLTFPQLTST